MRILRCFSILIVCALTLGFLPVVASSPVAHAETNDQGGAWYRYQGEPSSYDSHGNQQVNCGPTSASMAIQYDQQIRVPIRHVRAFIGKNGCGTTVSDLSWALNH